MAQISFVRDFMKHAVLETVILLLLQKKIDPPLKHNQTKSQIDDNDAEKKRGIYSTSLLVIFWMYY